MKREVRIVFKKYDTTGKGFLDDEEFSRLLQEKTRNDFSEE
jgi:hypothetical protein